MSDISANPIPDFGQLLSSYGQNQANIGLTQAQTGLAGANTGLARANTGLVGAQTGLVGLQAQRQTLEIQMIRDALRAQPQDTGKDEQSGVDPTETGIASSLNKKFFVDQQGPANLQRYLQNPQLAAVFPQVVQRADEMRKIAIEAQTARNQNEANDIFQTASTLATGDLSNPLQSLLSNTQPGSYLNNVGRAIASRQDLTADDKNMMAKDAINAAAKFSHQYTNRPIKPYGDELRDDKTGFPVFAPKIGPTAGEKIDIGKWSNTPQKVTIDNREATIRPKDLGISGYQDLVNNKSIKFSVAPPGAPAAQTKGAATGPTQTPNGKQDNTGQMQALKAAGLNDDQVKFVQGQPDAFPKLKNNQSLNPDDINQRNIYRKQAQELAQTSNLSVVKAQGTMANLQRIQQVLDTPNLVLGPGSREFSQLQTTMSQWFGTPSGQAPAYQILSKFLNADQMNRVLSEFHGEGAQVRLGAYESRLIMEQLAANPSMTKEAIQQMLKWQNSDTQYEYQKARTGAALAASGKQVSDFDARYSNEFPRQSAVDTTLSAFRSPKGQPNYQAASGKTYTKAQAEEAAQHYGIPSIQFISHLKQAGATVE